MQATYTGVKNVLTKLSSARHAYSSVPTDASPSVNRSEFESDPSTSDSSSRVGSLASIWSVTDQEKEHSLGTLEAGQRRVDLSQTTLHRENRNVRRRRAIAVGSIGTLLVVLIIIGHGLHGLRDASRDQGLPDVSGAKDLEQDENADSDSSGSVSHLIIGDPDTEEFTFQNTSKMDDDHRSISEFLSLAVKAGTSSSPDLTLSDEASRLYLSIPPHSQSTQPSIIPILQPVISLPDSLLEDWFLHGKLSSTSMRNLPPQPKLDVIFTWVNGSDTLWQLGQTEQAERNGIPQPRLKGVNRHWRENGMGRFGLRSVVEAFSQKEDEEDETIIGVKGNNGIRRIHVLTADLPMDGLGLTWENETSGEVGEGVIQTQEGRARWSLGQIPDWLDTSALVPLLDERVSSSGSGVELQWHFHSEAFHIAQSVFDMPDDIEHKSVSWANEKAWKDQALPTFNSFAIETQIGWLKGMSDVSIQMNDDMLLLGELSVSDFFSIPFGSVFRLEREFNLRVSPFNTPSNIGDSGEWGGLNHANSVLSQRFPSRPRHYLHHVPKTLTKPIIHEAMHMFPDAINLAATRSFRESKEGEGDIEMGFLITHLRIERWREALLWIWVVGKMGTLEGDEKGVWSHKARAELKNLLHFKAGESAVTVIKQERHTLKDVESVFKSAQGWDAPKSTSYSFSSMDGHLPALTMIETPKTCAIGLERCFGSWFASGKEKISAADMFKRLTFEQWECGDCLINALVNQSGKKGLNAFFPSAKTMISSTVDENLAYLPLTKSWLTTDFSIESIMVGAEALRPVSLRMWGMRMLSRYLYVTGETPMTFAQLQTPSQASSATKQLDDDRTRVMACFNDDARRGAGDRIATIMDEWLHRRFDGKQAYWENKTI